MAIQQYRTLICFATFLFIAIILLTRKAALQTEIEKDAQRKFELIHPVNDFDLPLIFVGGFPRSGTTIMRTMLDAHPDIRCGPETHVIPMMLFQRNFWRSGDQLMKRLEEAGVEPVALDIAIGRFILEIIKGHAPPSTYYCNKDPFALTEMKYIHEQLFPNAKFIYMIRDGRASAHSIVTKKVTMGGLDISSYRKILQFWNNKTEGMHRQCEDLGESICLPVYYEQLVLKPVSSTIRIFQFFDIPWCNQVLHHDRFINQTKLSQFEYSTDQVQKPIYLDSLTSWFDKIPHDVERDMYKIAPMLATLGYDPNNTHPVYGEPDDFVAGKLKL